MLITVKAFSPGARRLPVFFRPRGGSYKEDTMLYKIDNYYADPVLLTRLIKVGNR